MPSWEGKLGKAIAIAAEVHQNQTDKADVTYILHPLAVMERAKTFYQSISDSWHIEEVMIVAVLHDVFEDFKPGPGVRWLNINQLRSYVWEEFGDEVYSAVDALTKQTFYSTETPDGVKEPYEDYIGRVEKNWLASIAKIADASHNLDAFRLPTGEIKEYDYERWDKYHRTIVRLMKVVRP